MKAPPRFQTLSAWLNWLETLHPKAIDLGLERVRVVANNMGLTRPAPYVITVAGTNGKGSCVAFLESILRSSGHRVGCYTSPHLIHYNERIRLDGQPIAETLLCEALDFVDKSRGEQTLSYFEFGTLAAFYLFEQHALDCAILEVGMGGRLDAVNWVDCDLALISNVDFDHMDHLGNTLEAIGFEKAGIMRSGKPVVYGGDILPNSVLQRAEQLRAPLYYKDRDFSYTIKDQNWTWQSKSQTLVQLPLPHLPIPNAASVLQVVELLPARFKPKLEILKSCLANTQLAGRFQQQQLTNGAKIIFDVAHNPQSCTLLAKRLSSIPCQGKTYAIVGMLADKDISNSLAPLLEVIDKWCLISLNVARGARADQLGQQLLQLGAKPDFLTEDMEEACQLLLEELKSEDRIVVFGSFYTVGMGLTTLMGK